MYPKPCKGDGHALSPLPGLRTFRPSRTRGSRPWLPSFAPSGAAYIQTGTHPWLAPLDTIFRRYQGLIEEFTGGNKDIENSLRNMYRQEPDIASDHGYKPDPKMAEYVGKALQAVKNRS